MKATAGWARKGWTTLPDAPSGYRIMEPLERIPHGTGTTCILCWGSRDNDGKTWEHRLSWDTGIRDGSLGRTLVEDFCGFVAVREEGLAPKSPRKSPKLRETSSQAHESQKDKAPLDRVVLLDRIRKYPTGISCDRLEGLLGMKHQTASARLRDLAIAGKIVDSGRRETTSTGRKAICWKAVEA